MLAINNLLEFSRRNHLPVSFQGILSIEKPTEMISLMQTGIGPAKAFGCGLLSLARY
jgi:hypothetical protein